jgi:hypothetical protein
MLAMRFVLCALACAATSAGAAPRVALYRGASSSSGSGGNYSDVLANMASAGKIASVTTMTTEAEVAALAAADFDLVIFPGGSGSGESAAIGADGAAAVRAFVAAGKGYLGVCAGGYLAGHMSCCDGVIPGYCGGVSGCAPASYALQLLDIGVAQPWARGHGPVLVQYSDAAIAMLKLDAARYAGRNVSVLYYQGPIMARNYDGKYTSLATFNTEIHSGHTAYTTGQMVGTPALLYGSYGAGSGRVLISPPHPEETVPRLDDVVESYVLWAGGAL